MPVQIMYRQILYKGEISYNGETLCISFLENNSSVDKISFAIDEKMCEINHNELSKTFNRSSLIKDSIPMILFDFFSSLGVRFAFELENSENFILKRTYDKYSVEFRMSKATDLYYIDIK